MGLWFVFWFDGRCTLAGTPMISIKRNVNTHMGHYGEMVTLRYTMLALCVHLPGSRSLS